MRLLARIVIAWVSMGGLVAAGCGGDDAPPTVDAPSGVDAPAGMTTACGSTTCNSATHICVNDIQQNEACVALPTGCDAARTCASCGGACTGGTTCFDLPGENKIACH